MKVPQARREAENPYNKMKKDMKAAPQKSWDKMTRTEKRKARLRLPGSKTTIKCLDYIRKLAPTLPEAKMKDTGEPINHLVELVAWYMKKGVDGINEYTALIMGATADKVKDLEAENKIEFAKQEAEKKTVLTKKMAYNVDYYRDGKTIESTQIDEADEELAWGLFKEFGHTRQEGDTVDFQLIEEEDDGE